MRCIFVAGSLALAMAASGFMAQDASAQNVADTPRGETIVWVAQIELTRAGLYEGPYDGMMTAETEEAVEDFENIVGWPESGRVSPDLVMALKRYNLLVVSDDPDS